ncbi:ATP-binding cassette domain-containing protein [Alteromonas sp. 5E99-2]|uniref:ATP-binding cassette domain-containing protein n=1 Tax=Alteromonas sp. 5E99-2 TaxID=2817683 RepID=UPI001A99547C|nr:ATP-binding cassette domain-containing protein [Alteromonas sp. 5E99-2]MBO1255190.1 ATP-binding cassette domain-containing protein [Alteromonas sp. 5E99-2]
MALIVNELYHISNKTKFELGPISVTVEKGKSLAIIGENQSGKSLLAKILVGATKLSGGNIVLHGVRSDSRERKKAIRMMFQFSSHTLNPSLSVKKILEEPLIRNTSLSATERVFLIEQTLIQVGLLREHLHFYRHMLSDGQQQRIALARAIILSPKVLVADEPFATLDPSIRSQTINLILKLQDELGLSFIFISHNLGIVRHIADNVMVLDKGKAVEIGKTETIFRWPKHDVTKRLITSYQSLIPQQTLTD